MSDIKKHTGANSAQKTETGETVNAQVSAEIELTPSDTDPIPYDWQGCGLFVNITDESKRVVGVQVSLSLVQTPETFITRYLSHGYHPIKVYQLKATDTDVTGVSYIGQL